jgi:hypothetical protein
MVFELFFTSTFIITWAHSSQTAQVMFVGETAYVRPYLTEYGNSAVSPYPINGTKQVDFYRVLLDHFINPPVYTSNLYFFVLNALPDCF